MNDQPTRKNIRLKDYDYSRTGAYFVTVCVKDRHEILWDDIRAHNAHPEYSAELSDVGRIVDGAIKGIPQIYPHITLDKYVIMPNHIHMLLFVGNGRAMRAPTSLSTVICQFKGYVTKQVGYSIWQKLFHDHIIRSREEYRNIREYICENPVKWTEDCYYGKHVNE